MSNWDSASSVHQARLHHGLRHLILRYQLVPVDGVRVDIQSSADVGMPQNGLYRLNVGLGLGDQVGSQGVAEVVEAESTPIVGREDCSVNIHDPSRVRIESSIFF